MALGIRGGMALAGELGLRFARIGVTVLAVDACLLHRLGPNVELTWFFDLFRPFGAWMFKGIDRAFFK